MRFPYRIVHPGAADEPKLSLYYQILVLTNGTLVSHLKHQRKQYVSPFAAVTLSTMKYLVFSISWFFAKTKLNKRVALPLAG